MKCLYWVAERNKPEEIWLPGTYRQDHPGKISFTAEDAFRSFVYMDIQEIIFLPDCIHVLGLELVEDRTFKQHSIYFRPEFTPVKAKS